MNIDKSPHNFLDNRYAVPGEKGNHQLVQSRGEGNRESDKVDQIELADGRLTTNHDPLDPRRETLRALRTELLLRRESMDRADVVVILSPCAGEGRSLLAAELAITFAQTGHPTLLVDADFRRPQQHLLFGVQNDHGLSQAIEFGENPLLYKIKGLQRMSLLTSGNVPGDPLELLSSHRLALMVDEWRDIYEFVVIDTAPVRQYSDGLAVASIARRVLALSRAQHTPFKDMQEMLRRLAATRSHILGAVVNHF
jgi:receptor protein-tyrosine kinase